MDEKKALIVCGDKDIQEMICSYFQRVSPDFFCECAFDYQEACGRILEDYYELTLAESGKFSIDGIGLFKAIKLLYGPEAKIILMPENPNALFSEARARIGEPDFLNEIMIQCLPMPFSLKDFRAMVYKVGIA